MQLEDPSTWESAPYAIRLKYGDEPPPVVDHRFVPIAELQGMVLRERDSAAALVGRQEGAQEEQRARGQEDYINADDEEEEEGEEEEEKEEDKEDHDFKASKEHNNAANEEEEQEQEESPKEHGVEEDTMEPYNNNADEEQEEDQETTEEHNNNVGAVPLQPRRTKRIKVKPLRKPRKVLRNPVSTQKYPEAV